MPTAAVLALDADSFAVVVSGATEPVLVDFWAPWCGPCRALAPKLEQISERFAGKLLVRKLNVDEAPDIAASMGVRGIPTLMLFKDGRPTAQLVGLQSDSQLSDWIASALNPQSMTTTMTPTASSHLAPSVFPAP